MSDKPDHIEVPPGIESLRGIKFADPADARDFSVGREYIFEHGRLLTGWRLRWWRMRQLAIHWTRWWRPRTVCSAIDAERGIVTMAEERWSWRRWRWERS